MKQLGISRGYYYAILADPDGSKDRERRASYAGTCEICGAPTDGSNGREKAPIRCLKHNGRRRWSREKIIDAIQRFAAEHGGRPPTAMEWRRCNPEKGYPAFATTYERKIYFNTWSEAIEAAGFPRPTSGTRVMRPHLKRKRERPLKEQIEEARAFFATYKDEEWKR